MELERQGYEILSLNIGNPGMFGFRTPETMRLAMIENLGSSEAYCGQKGIFPAREAVVMRQQSRGVMDTTAEEVFIGNGVSELIDLTLRALLNAGDEVLIPSPDYPLWTAATVLNGGKAVHYPCPEQNGYAPDPDELEKLVTAKTRAIVIINPNNPTGAVYSRECLTRLAEIAKQNDLLILADEIYDQMIYGDTEFVPMATLCTETLCATFSGLSKVYRACGYRVGWVAFSGALDRSGELLEAMDLLAALRLCSNVPGQWAVQTALGGYQSIRKLCSGDGRLNQSRQAVISAVDESKYLTLVPRTAPCMHSSASTPASSPASMTNRSAWNCWSSNTCWSHPVPASIRDTGITSESPRSRMKIRSRRCSGASRMSCCGWPTVHRCWSPPDNPLIACLPP